MTTKQTWFITGAGRGMGVDIARAALHAGHAVVATGRDPAKVSAAIGPAEDLLPVELDITDPGFFRTDLLTDTSTVWPEPTIDDYADRTRQTIGAWRSMSGQQGGDPAKLARGLVGLAGQAEPPLRWVAGADAVAAVEQKAQLLLAQLDAHRALSSSLDHTDV